MNTRAITVNVNEAAVKRIGLIFGDDVSTKEGAEDFFNLALVTLLAMGEEIQKGRVIVAMNKQAVGGFNGKMFNFPRPVLRQVK